jgi:hypothetical protein
LSLPKYGTAIVGEYFRTSESSFTGGVLLNFWMPRANEKMYFRTGLLYSKYEEIIEDGYENAEHAKTSSQNPPNV